MNDSSAFASSFAKRGSKVPRWLHNVPKQDKHKLAFGASTGGSALWAMWTVAASWRAVGVDVRSEQKG